MLMKDFLISHLDKVGFLKPAEKKQQMIILNACCAGKQPTSYIALPQPQGY